MANNLLRFLRKLHLYFGLLIAPALLFFAFTGAVQTLSLHDPAGKSYQPPAFLVELGQLHKKQTIMIPPAKPSPAPPNARDHAPAPSNPPKEITLAAKQRQHLPMKIFFLVVALGLLSSTFSGIYMAYRYTRTPILVTGVLLCGILIPLVLLRF